MAFSTVKHKKRVTWMLFWTIVGFVIVAGRLFYVQIIKGSYYAEKASLQQTKDRAILASRGTIYDAAGNKLALSVSTNTLTVAPTNIKTEDTEKIAKDWAEILEVSSDDVLAKIKAVIDTANTVFEEESEETEE